jgi:hypothetical protein
LPSNGGRIDATIYVYGYDSIYDAREDRWRNRFTTSAFSDIKDEDVGDVSYFWTNNITYSLAFIKGNVIVGVKLVNNTPDVIDGEAIIKEIGSKQAEKITNWSTRLWRTQALDSKHYGRWPRTSVGVPAWPPANRSCGISAKWSLD